VGHGHERSMVLTGDGNGGRWRTVASCGHEQKGRRGFYRRGHVRKGGSTTTMATGVTTWVARRLATCARPVANGGRRCGLRRVGGSHVAPA
jgi:hypothetical protein